MKPILEVRGLKTHFFTDAGVVRSVDGVDFTIKQGEILGIVGESGCGKSVTSLSIMRLIPSPPGKTVGGEIMFQGKNLLAVSEKEMRSIRGNEIAMIFQEPMTSLNPAFRIGAQICEAIQLHLGIGRSQARQRAVELLREVGIPRPEQLIFEYPHQLSGGMRQRVMIAMAMACRPKLLIADEPTTALDVTIQAQILTLMRRIRDEAGTSIMLITHDLGVVAETCDRVVVMYAGKVIEEADVKTLFKNPKHPYTQGLLQSVPKLKGPRERLYSIPGSIPVPHAMPKGCKFAPRCPLAGQACWESEPELLGVDERTLHHVRCWLHHDSRSAADLVKTAGKGGTT
ncbi:ABC transporter ATP-binding protein [Brevibacillus massiliensis]|jgi:oligopeptide/dipeptide ABC transporter ATP-binding protein|uniref:ABC transporter ATP-binding protein n=1 Tax=Brevibacillus massiliensis TaxID=1118054 RepID=UPI0002D3CEC6|nr:ABC transporter ATP-binding protein [Brevibacillus massiliensis]